jgi:hypothetical protein
MQRLNDKQLDERIHKFLYRKFTQYPELTGAAARKQPLWPEKTETQERTHLRWGLQPY